MDHRQDNTAGLLMSLAVHAIFVACLALATISCERYNALLERLQLPEFMTMECARPISVQGPIIEATLVKFTAPPLPKPTRSAVAAPRPAVTPPPKPPQERIEAPVVPPAPPRAEDNVNQEQVARDGQLPAIDQRKEQEEKRKREQQLLDEQARLARVEQERQKQLEDIRRQREEAEARRKREEEKLAQLEDRQRAEAAAQQREDESRHLQELLENAKLEDGQLAGNEGTDTDLLSRYKLALESAVTSNWLRPDSTQPGLKCTVSIVQIPGGEVLSATVVSPCNGDEITRTSIEQAVMRAQPLPYQGYESVFQRTVNFNFSYDG